jgi:histidinol-phosphate aminotransferase
MNFDLNKLLRENIKKVTPYSSARDEFAGEARVFLDANENSLGSPLKKWYNRYPDPHQLRVKNALGKIKGIPAENIFLGNGSDECIDLIYRCFCEPGKDNVVLCPPTYGMYEVSAAINDIATKKVPLLPDFQIDMEGVEAAIDAHTKIIWLCSPNNPTGNSLSHGDMELVLNNFDGLVVVDEAYINFARQASLIRELTEYPNLIVMQTLSKAWGLAALRLGIAFASTNIISWLNKIKPPYNINQATQELALEALEEVAQVNEMIRTIVELREDLAKKLGQMSVVERVYPSDANFLLVKFGNARRLYEHLLARGIVVRDRSNIKLCESCLRITVGTENENKKLIEGLESFR